MRTPTIFVMGCLLLAQAGTRSQEKARIVPLIKLLVRPEEFNGTRVTVLGFLVMAPHHGGLVTTNLYLHREDADNLLGNSILVVPSDQMQKDEEKLNRMYVRLTGTFHDVPAADGGLIPEMDSVVSCLVWSDPGRPRGLKLTPAGAK